MERLDVESRFDPKLFALNGHFERMPAEPEHDTQLFGHFHGGACDVHSLGTREVIPAIAPDIPRRGHVILHGRGECAFDAISGVVSGDIDRHDSPQLAATLCVVGADEIGIALQQRVDALRLGQFVRVEQSFGRVVRSSQCAHVDQISRVSTRRIATEDQPADLQIADRAERHPAGQCLWFGGPLAIAGRNLFGLGSRSGGSRRQPGRCAGANEISPCYLVACHTVFSAIVHVVRPGDQPNAFPLSIMAHLDTLVYGSTDFRRLYWVGFAPHTVPTIPL